MTRHLYRSFESSSQIDISCDRGSSVIKFGLNLSRVVTARRYNRHFCYTFVLFVLWVQYFWVVVSIKFSEDCIIEYLYWISMFTITLRCLLMFILNSSTLVFLLLQS